MKTLEERLRDRVMKTENGCHLWIGSLRSGGYGQISVAGSMRSAHRISYELANGPIPEGEGYHGTCVCHRCDVLTCVNPDHLFLGTHDDNMKDKVRKGREYNRDGESNPKAKLTEADVVSIRASTKTLRDLAKEYGVTFGMIGHIKNRRSWTNVA